jgi:hypothetical protein
MITPPSLESLAPFSRASRSFLTLVQRRIQRDTIAIAHQVELRARARSTGRERVATGHGCGEWVRARARTYWYTGTR